ncbi:hypothetical protein CHU_2381 [Cytophaga hutchinsonii ATCC 33406]|uniref:Uncharacterized protein n=1 Tax=Cytophaga hutchinsonii (strain ATCC 33406 / DSM 1761 / CIP 103989 / NBRC 15051 / NCIMB 9469 / D465) TaxID=269798 RepID=A0A6N4ST71_CYTH3|nr:hypothetical protein CHU_2381 [Cytophaga hutchinsonii ATCC 33406]SFX66785.1 hypothetical protein SAMN04487930_107151 [Cytophaga hutchinsonii ATCC 33406]
MRLQLLGNDFILLSLKKCETGKKTISMIKKNGLSGFVINRILINHSLGSDERNVFE